MTVVIGYTCVTVAGRLGGRKRILFAVSVVIMTIVSGKYIYTNAYFGRAQNLYHVPDSVVHICDAIEIPGREVTAVFPLEMVQYVRQYSPVVCMPYGREILVEAWNEWAVQNRLCDVMEAETVEAGELGRLAREEGCIYIVLPESKVVQGDLRETGYEYFDRMDGYVIYMDKFFNSSAMK